jgi:hypothetical protein
MGLGVHRHGAGGFLRRHSLHHVKLIASIFLDHGDRAVSRRSKRQAKPGIECGRVASLSNGEARNRFPSVGINDRHLLVPTPGKQAPAFPVDRQALRLFAVRQFPTRTSP